jgi:hypothetical protein
LLGYNLYLFLKYLNLPNKSHFLIRSHFCKYTSLLIKSNFLYFYYTENNFFHLNKIHKEQGIFSNWNTITIQDFICLNFPKNILLHIHIYYLNSKNYFQYKRYIYNSQKYSLNNLDCISNILTLFMKNTFLLYKYIFLNLNQKINHHCISNNYNRSHKVHNSPHILHFNFNKICK